MSSQMPDVARTATMVCVAVGIGALAVTLMPSGGQAQTPAYRAPRATDGHPDLNGIFQALNTANIEARPAIDLGAAGGPGRRA